jgi:putative membrane protein
MRSRKLWNNAGGICCGCAALKNPHFSRLERARNGALAVREVSTTNNAKAENVNSNPNRARDHLANERTFLAWVRTGAAIVVFGFAIGRFSIAMRQLTALEGHVVRTAGMSVWMGSGAIVAGVAMVVAGLVRYRKTRAQLDSGTFEPAGFVLDFITVLTVLFGMVLAGYLIYTEKVLG